MNRHFSWICLGPVLLFMFVAMGCAFHSPDRITLKVTDSETGAPITNVHIHALREGYGLGFPLSKHFVEGKRWESDDASGEIKMDMTKEKWAVTLEAEGYVPARFEWSYKGDIRVSSPWTEMGVIADRNNLQVKMHKAPGLPFWGYIYDSDVPNTWDGVARYCVVDFETGAPLSGVVVGYYDETDPGKGKLLGSVETREKGLATTDIPGIENTTHFDIKRDSGKPLVRLVTFHKEGYRDGRFTGLMQNGNTWNWGYGDIVFVAMSRETPAK